MPLDSKPDIAFPYAHVPQRLCARGGTARRTHDRTGASSSRNTYTAGVICAKVARYAERIHHPVA